MTRFRLHSTLGAALATLALAGGCAAPASAPRETAVPSPDAARTATPRGTVALAPDSPMLQQLRRQPVETATLPLTEVVSPGKIDVTATRVAKIVPPVAGRITEVLVRLGDRVKQGQPLLTLASPDADAATSTALAAEAALTQAQAALIKAKADAERAADLFAHNALAKKEVLVADSALAQATAAVEQARAAREQATRRLSLLGLAPGAFAQGVVVRAPLAGTVLELNAVAGEFRNDTNAPLLTVADLSRVWATSQVPERDIRFIRAGERVAVSLVAYPGETFEGRVSRIADTVDPQTRTVRVEADVDNADGRLRPEMFGSMRHIGVTAALPVVPAAAVIQHGDRSVVFVETAPGRFEQRAVSLGTPDGQLVRVLTGVRAGDSIVVDGALLLDGMVSGT